MPGSQPCPLVRRSSRGSISAFFVSWPWLWAAPIERLQQFLGTATERAPLDVFYWGQAFSDRDVPWHYAWGMFGVTVPLVWLLLGGVGLAAGRRRWLDDPLLSSSSLRLLLRITQRDGRVLAENSLDGVWLSRLYELPAEGQARPQR